MAVNEEKVIALGRFFAVAMDKRDGLASQEQVNAEVENVLAAFRRPVDDLPDGGVAEPSEGGDGAQ